MDNQNISERAYRLSQNGYYFNSTYYVQQAIQLIKPQWFILSVFTAAYLILLILLMRTPQIGNVVQMIIGGPISAGYYLVMRRIMNGETIRFDHFFDGFNHFLSYMVVYMLSGLLVSIGFVLLIVPGIFLTIIYFFAMPLVVFGGLDFWPAMESSRVIIMKKFWDAALFGLMIIGINLLGLLALGVGVLFTLPLTYAMITIAYNDIYGFDSSEQETNDFSHFR
jgi:uncharacterized membrane protein